LSLVNQAQILFLLGGLVLLMFLILIEVAIAETHKTTHKSLRFCKDLRSHCRIGHSDSLFWSMFFTTFVAGQ